MRKGLGINIPKGLSKEERIRKVIEEIEYLDTNTYHYNQYNIEKIVGEDNEIDEGGASTYIIYYINTLLEKYINEKVDTMPAPILGELDRAFEKKLVSIYLAVLFYKLSEWLQPEVACEFYQGYIEATYEYENSIINKVLNCKKKGNKKSFIHAIVKAEKKVIDIGCYYQYEGKRSIGDVNHGEYPEYINCYGWKDNEAVEKYSSLFFSDEPICLSGHGLYLEEIIEQARGKMQKQ